MNKKPMIFILLLVVVSFVVGGTIAYYTSNDTFNNEFDTGTYVIQTQENFESPDNWTPGTTTDKTVIATNKGTTPAAVRIKLTPSWVGSDGVTTLPLTDGTNEAAIINFAFDKDYKWIKEGDWYYYIRPLDTNESTSSLLESVTFNPNVNISATHNCVENETTHETICTTETTGYGDATYKLKVDIETCQFDKYQEIWNTSVDVSKPETVLTGTLMVQPDNINNVFGKTINKDNFEMISTIDVIDIPANAIDSWDCSNEQNESVMCWYTDKDNNGKYELFISQDGGVMANSNSSQSFSWYQYADTLHMDYLNTSNVTNMNNMFAWTCEQYACNNTFRITGLEKWDTSNVQNMSKLFYYMGRNAKKWSIGDISNWDTSKVTTMEYMFTYVANKANDFSVGNIGKWNVSSVESMAYMFNMIGQYSASKCYFGDLTNWDTFNVTNMSYMFGSSCQNADKVDLGTLNVYADNISGIFSNAREINVIVNLWNKPSSYSSAFPYYQSQHGAQITVNYSSSVTNIDDMILNSNNTVKGDQLD